LVAYVLAVVMSVLILLSSVTTLIFLGTSLASSRWITAFPLSFSWFCPLFSTRQVVSWTATSLVLSAQIVSATLLRVAGCLSFVRILGEAGLELIIGVILGAIVIQVIVIFVWMFPWRVTASLIPRSVFTDFVFDWSLFTVTRLWPFFLLQHHKFRFAVTWLSLMFLSGSFFVKTTVARIAKKLFTIWAVDGAFKFFAFLTDSDSVVF